MCAVEVYSPGIWGGVMYLLLNIYDILKVIIKLLIPISTLYERIHSFYLYVLFREMQVIFIVNLIPLQVVFNQDIKRSG